MTTFQTKKEPPLRGVSPTPSKIPVPSKRRPPLPTVKSCALDQENQDPKRLEQKTSIQRPLLDSAFPRPKATHQEEKSERLVGSTLLRNPLEELRPSHKGQNVGPGPPPQTEVPGVIEFVADPEALATILSGEGVKSCGLGRQPSLAQRVLVRGSQGGTIRRGQGARASAYLAPRTPQNRLDPARASCFSRLEGPGPRSRTLCAQRLEAVIPSSGPSFHSSALPSFQRRKRETGGSSRTSVSHALGLLLETPAQPGEHEVAAHSDEEGKGPLGLTGWVPLRETQEITHTKDRRDCHPVPSPGHGLLPSITRPSPFGLAQRVPSPGPSALTSHSALRRHAIRPKTQFTPIPSAPRAQQVREGRGCSWHRKGMNGCRKGYDVSLLSQVRCLSGLSPQSCPEEPALSWEHIAVRLFDQESCKRWQEGPGEPPVATPYGSHPTRTPSFQELKMQRISILQQLLQQEVQGLAGSKCAPLNGSSSLDMVELQPLLAEIPRTLNAPQLDPGASHLPELVQHSGLPKPCPPEECGEAQLCPGAEPALAQACPPAELGPPESCHRREPEIPGPATREQPATQERPATREQPLVSEACPPAQPGPLLACSPGAEPGASEAGSLEPRRTECSPQPCCCQGAPATTSVTFSSQHPLCASPPICSLQSLRPPTGQAGPSSLAPRTLALRQRLKACLTAIHCFHEARLDDECAFYTSRAPPSGRSRVCTNPVAKLLEWQDALCFIPIGSAAPQDSPS
ncbi:tastin isoform X2 [Artibeus jamaicensis]|uniref:tastin isoform X2 n=1 Tax=Artibeus jamaicensis TaxID=9417 RepID=UPI00235A7618|nr:tastin isoform X2 [Artibeus jamaicensis]